MSYDIKNCFRERRYAPGRGIYTQLIQYNRNAQWPYRYKEINNYTALYGDRITEKQTHMAIKMIKSAELYKDGVSISVGEIFVNDIAL